jgi:hypothetical protein
MSARLNMNKIRPVIWKGQTFNQIMSGIKMNTKTLNPTSNHNLFKPQPLEHYRREIASTTADNCVRPNMSIDVLLQPGGSIVNSASANANTEGVVDFNLTNNKTERPGSCVGICSDRADDARRRVRSAGMITKKFNAGANNDTYYTSNHQYLVNRSRTIKQNEYTHFHTGDRTAVPGAPGSGANIYKPNGITHCPEVKIAVSNGNNTFNYIWLDATETTITIPDGNYNIGELNDYFKSKLIINKHYIRDTTNTIFIHLFNFVFDSATNRIQIQCAAASQAIFPSPRYLIPVGATWTIPATAKVPSIKILPNNFQNVFGFVAGTYPSTPQTTNQIFTGSAEPKIAEPFVPLYYKPSNSKFASQGGVDAGARLARLKYDTITNSANSFRTAFGNQTANALAYGVPNPGPTNNLKDKLGYPNTCSPTINPRTGVISKCKTSRIGW